MIDLKAQLKGKALTVRRKFERIKGMSRTILIDDQRGWQRIAAKLASEHSRRKEDGESALLDTR